MFYNADFANSSYTDIDLLCMYVNFACTNSCLVDQSIAIWLDCLVSGATNMEYGPQSLADRPEVNTAKSEDNHNLSLFLLQRVSLMINIVMRSYSKNCRVCNLFH